MEKKLYYHHSDQKYRVGHVLKPHRIVLEPKRSVFKTLENRISEVLLEDARPDGILNKKPSRYKCIFLVEEPSKMFMDRKHLYIVEISEHANVFKTSQAIVSEIAMRLQPEIQHMVYTAAEKLGDESEGYDHKFLEEYEKRINKDTISPKFMKKEGMDSLVELYWSDNALDKEFEFGEPEILVDGKVKIIRVVK